MNKIILFAVCISAALAGFGNAQTEEDKKLLAGGPLFVNPMPAFSQWAVDYTYTDAPKPGDEKSRMERLQKAAQQDPALARELNNPQFLFTLKNIRPKRIIITKTGKIRHEERLMEQGYKGESWRVDDLEVERLPNLPKLSAKIMSNFAAKDFAELEWISKGNFTGIQSDKGRKCFVFKQDRYDDERNLLGTASAYIDIDTRYPVLFRFLTEVRQYTILPPPTVPLAVPEEFAAAGKAMVDMITKATPHLSPP